MTPAHLRAFIGMLIAGPAALSRAPGRALARILDVTPARAGQLIAGLLEHGLIDREEGRRAISIVSHRRGSMLHCHGPDEPCPGEATPGELFDWLQGTIPNRPIEIDDEVRALIGRPKVKDPVDSARILDLSATPEEIPERSRRPTHLPGSPICGCLTLFFDQLSPFFSLVGRKKKKKLSMSIFDGRGQNQISGRDRMLMRFYERKRQRVDPLYEVEERRADQGALRKASRMLQARRIHPRWWADYVDYVWEEFPRVCGKRMTFPPAKILASEWFIDCYHSERPQRIDVAQAGKLLRRAGHAVHAGTIVSICRDAITGSMPTGLPEEYLAAVEWLLPRLRDVGYVGVDPPRSFRFAVDASGRTKTVSLEDEDARDLREKLRGKIAATRERHRLGRLRRLDRRGGDPRKDSA